MSVDYAERSHQKSHGHGQQNDHREIVSFNEGCWSVSVRDDEPSVQFAVRSLLPGYVSAATSVRVKQVRCVVEICRFVGPVSPRSLIGGAFLPVRAGQLAILVPESGELTNGAPKTCRSVGSWTFGRVRRSSIFWSQKDFSS